MNSSATTARVSHPGRLVVGLAFGIGMATWAAAAPVALAQDQAVIEKMVTLNKKAMEDIDTADFDPAKKALIEAEKVGKRAGLDSHPVMARTYVHLGALYILGYRDNKKGQSYFVKALEIQPDIKLDKNLSIAAVQEAFSAAQEQKGITAEPEAAAPAGRKGRTKPEAAPPPEPAQPSKKGRVPAAPDPDAEPQLPTEVTGFHCPYKDEVPPGKKVVLRCVAAPKLGVDKVVLNYKGFHMDDFELLPMRKDPKGVFEIEIPRKRVNGTSLQFYFEGLNAAGDPVVSDGRAESPNVILIVEKRKDVVQGKLGEDENPLDEKNRFTPRLILGTDRSKIGVDPRYGNRRFWLGIGAGTGATYAIAGVPESRVRGYNNQTSDVEVTGFGFSSLAHLAPELGVQFNPDWAVSIQGRHQYITGGSAFSARGAHAVLLRLIRYTKQQRLRFYLAAAGGGGEGTRMTVFYPDPMKLSKDTILVGGILVGGSGGLIYEISKRLSWVAESNVLLGFPKKGVQIDFNTALQINIGDTTFKKVETIESVAGSVDEDPKD
jgi:hypothetical protein